MGTFGPKSEPYVHALPERLIPEIPLAKGRYKIKISYFADNLDEVLHTEPTHEITIT